jgi:hypothetical protein
MQSEHAVLHVWQYSKTDEYVQLLSVNKKHTGVKVRWGQNVSCVMPQGIHGWALLLVPPLLATTTFKRR